MVERTGTVPTLPRFLAGKRRALADVADGHPDFRRTLEEWEAAGCPPAGQRPGEGTSIGKLGISTGELIDSPRYGGAGTPKPDFDVELDYAPLWAGESVDVVNDVLLAGEIVRRLARQAKRA